MYQALFILISSFIIWTSCAFAQSLNTVDTKNGSPVSIPLDLSKFNQAEKSKELKDLKNFQEHLQNFDRKFDKKIDLRSIQRQGGTSSNGGGDMSALTKPDELSTREKRWSTWLEKLNHLWSNLTFTQQMKNQVQKLTSVQTCSNDSTRTYPVLPAGFENTFAISIENSRAESLIHDICIDATFNEIYWYFSFNLLNIKQLEGGMGFQYGPYLLQKISERWGKIPVVLTKNSLKIKYDSVASEEATWVDLQTESIHWTNNRNNKIDWHTNAVLFLHESVNWAHKKILGQEFPDTSSWHRRVQKDDIIYDQGTSEEIAFIEGIANALARRTYFEEAFNVGNLYENSEGTRLCYLNSLRSNSVGAPQAPKNSEYYVGGTINALMYQVNAKETPSGLKDLNEVPSFYSYSANTYKDILEVFLAQPLKSVQDLAVALDIKKKSNSARTWLREYYLKDYATNHDISSLFYKLEINSRPYACTDIRNSDLFYFPAIEKKEQQIRDNFYAQIANKTSREELTQYLQSKVASHQERIGLALDKTQQMPLSAMTQKLHEKGLCRENLTEKTDKLLNEQMQRKYEAVLYSTKGIFTLFSEGTLHSVTQRLCAGKTLQTLAGHSAYENLLTVSMNKPQAVTGEEIKTLRDTREFATIDSSWIEALLFIESL